MSSKPSGLAIIASGGSSCWDRLMLLPFKAIIVFLWLDRRSRSCVSIFLVKDATVFLLEFLRCLTDWYWQTLFHRCRWRERHMFCHLHITRYTSSYLLLLQFFRLSKFIGHNFSWYVLLEFFRLKGNLTWLNNRFCELSFDLSFGIRE